MTTFSNEHTAQPSSTTLTTHRKAAPWGYFFYCEVLRIFRNPPAVLSGIAFPTLFS